MKKIGIFFGSTTGTTAKVARSIARVLGVNDNDVHDVANAAPSEVGGYDILVLGTSTWGSGELQDNWYDFAAGLSVMNLKGKQIAIYGCGDETMSDTFCSAVGELRKRLNDTGADFIAPYNVVGYHFNHSDALAEDAVEAEGLLLDEVNHPELTEGRIAGWCTVIQKAAD
ncbi:MAG: flavodoxin [Bacteroidales bacterium]|nr:flavodoxin [Bacteroidales bacterium]